MIPGVWIRIPGPLRHISSWGVFFWWKIMADTGKSYVTSNFQKKTMETTDLYGFVSIVRKGSDWHGPNLQLEINTDHYALFVLCAARPKISLKMTTGQTRESFSVHSLHLLLLWIHILSRWIKENGTLQGEPLPRDGTWWWRQKRWEKRGSRSRGLESLKSASGK